MAKIKSQIPNLKSQKVLRFKHIPSKKEKDSKKVVKNKSQVSSPALGFQNNEHEETPAFSPKIYRFITEPWFLAAVLSVVLLLSISILGKNIQQNLQKKKDLAQQREKIQREISYWQGVTRKYSGYRDAYFKLALLEYQLGNFQVAQTYIEKTKMLDPNFQETEKLEQYLRSGSTANP